MPSSAQNAIDGNYDMWYELVAFTAGSASQEGIDLMTAVNSSLGNPEHHRPDGPVHHPGWPA